PHRTSRPRRSLRAWISFRSLRSGVTGVALRSLGPGITLWALRSLRTGIAFGTLRPGCQFGQKSHTQVVVARDDSYGPCVGIPSRICNGDDDVVIADGQAHAHGSDFSGIHSIHTHVGA